MNYYPDGAFSFVNRDIPAGELWYGIPARYQGNTYTHEGKIFT
jgi:serine acetyltransferase